MRPSSALAYIDPLVRARTWFATQGWRPFAFQEEVWAAYARGASGLVHAPTGMGKTYATALPPILLGPIGAPHTPPPLSLLWITPMRALAGDTGLALTRAATDLAPHWTVDVRTGDTGPAARARQEKRLPTALVPRWAGGPMALSTQLAEATRHLIAAAKAGVYASPELQLVRPLLELQARWSGLPGANEWLIEQIATREGYALFFYPFEGRLGHLGLATLFSYRLSRATARTFSLTANDYGFGLLSSAPLTLTLGELGRLLAAPGVEADMLAGLNAAELGRRQFREIAHIAGLVFQGYPGEPNPARHLQASSALLYEVFAEFDPENLLLAQAVREVLERRLEAPRIAAALARLRRSRALLTRPARPTPFAFPLLVEMFREELSTEALDARVARMVEVLEREATRSGA